MRVSVAVLALLLGPSLLQAQESDESSGHPVFGQAPQVERLRNGLTVVTLPWNTPGIVAYYHLVRVGSRDEVEPGHSGFAHLFEHMMFRGTERVPGSEYEERIQSFGADNNAYTTRDFTLYTVTAPSSVLADLVELEADRFQNLSYSQDVFRTETGAVQGEYAKNASNPFLPMWEALSEISFSRHTYGHTTMGYLRDICAMPEMYNYSRQFFRRFYTPDNTTVIAVGDVEHAAVMQLVNRHYGRWRGRRANPRIPAEPEPTEGARRHIPWDGSAPPQVFVGYRGPSFDGGHSRGANRVAALKESAALEVVKGLMFAESAPLYQRLVVREQKLLSLGAWDYDFHRDPGLFVVRATLKPTGEAPQFDEILSAVQSELSRIAEGNVSEQRLDAVRSHSRYAMLTGLETPADVADLIGGVIASGGRIEALDEYFAALAALTPADVAAAARKYLTEARRFVVTLAPRQESDGPAPPPRAPCAEDEEEEAAR